MNVDLNVKNFKWISNNKDNDRKQINEFSGKNQGLGFGDLINKISVYNRFTNEPTDINWYYTESDYEKVQVISDLIFEKNKNLNYIKKPDIPYEDRFKFFTLKINDIINKNKLVNHTYQSCKVKKSDKKTKCVALVFYVNEPFADWKNLLKDPNWQYFNDKIVDREFVESVISNLHNLGYKYRFLFDINDTRGNDKVITKSYDLVKTNLDILSKVDAFIGVEGGWSHVARSMELPSLLFYRMSVFSEFLRNEFLEPFQYIENNEEEFIYRMNQLLKSKFFFDV